MKDQLELPLGDTESNPLLRVLKKFRLDIEDALCYSYDSHSFNDVVEMLLSGEAHMHELPNSVIIAEVQQTPNHKVYNIFIAAGNLHEVLEAQNMLIEISKELGCKFMSFSGRLGWAKVLKNKGWSAQLITAYHEV